MPWSEWQEPLLDTRTPTVLRLLWSEEGSQAAVTDIGGTYRSEASGDGTHWAVLGYQFTAPPDWATARFVFPPLLNTLEQGVDYAMRPDRDADDPDRWVEYEAGPNVITGWATPTLQVAGYNDDYGRTFQIGLLSGTAYVEGQEGFAYPGAGAPFGSLGPGTPQGAALPDYDPGTVSAFSISMSRVDDLSTDVNVQVTYARPTVQTNTPRWRYWIPGVVAPKPLRQRQRGDGLGLSVGRWRASGSRQSSNRWRGYL